MEEFEDIWRGACLIGTGHERWSQECNFWAERCGCQWERWVRRRLAGMRGAAEQEPSNSRRRVREEKPSARVSSHGQDVVRRRVRAERRVSRVSKF